MAKPSRWTAEKRYQIVKEALSQKEPMGQIARRHQVSEALIYRWREKFFEGGKAGLAFDGRKGVGGEKAGALPSGQDSLMHQRASEPQSWTAAAS
jgi:transposase-like protein